MSHPRNPPSSHAGLRAALLALAVLAASQAKAGVGPQPVSPGNTDRFVGVADRCPTFSWSGLAGAREYELVLWELPATAIEGPSANELWELEPMLHQVLPAATSWTPDLEHCLEGPGRFVWFVRAGGEAGVDDQRPGGWSGPLLFELLAAGGEPRPGRAEAVKGARNPRAAARRPGRDPIASDDGPGDPARRSPGDAPGFVQWLSTPAATEDRAAGSAATRQSSSAILYPGPAALEARRSEPTGDPVFGVRGVVTSASVFVSSGVYGQYDNSQGQGVGVGVIGVSRAEVGYGVYGEAIGPSGTGVFGRADGISGVGVLGGEFNGFTGVEAYSPDAGGVAGAFINVGGGALLRGCSSYPCDSPHFEVSANGAVAAEVGAGDYAVLGSNTSLNTFARGVLGKSASPTGRGVFGDATATSGDNAGVVGRSYSASGAGGVFVNQANGDVLRGQTAAGEVFRVQGNGSVFADGSFNCGLASGCFNAGQGADLAERIDPVEPLAPGDVVEVDPERPGLFRRSRGAYSPRVVGVVSSSPAITLNNNDLADQGVEPGSDRRPLLALTGKVPVRVSDENGPIAPGDLLVSSSTSGAAMRCVGIERCFGATIGKALEAHVEGAGRILMLVFPN
jgi:hypothetical protein